MAFLSRQTLPLLTKLEKIYWETRVFKQFVSARYDCGLTAVEDIFDAAENGVERRAEDGADVLIFSQNRMDLFQNF